MKALFNLIHIIIMMFIVITGNSFYDQILSAIIAVIAFVYAYSFVGCFSSDLGYNSLLMSLVHWTIRTLASITMILITRPIFIIAKLLIGTPNDNASVIFAVLLCAILWIVVAEVFKSIAGLRKNYW